MPRAMVTPELAETLRSIRIQNKVQAKDLAEHIKKSPAFISKLENGKIQTIDTKELYSILRFITRETSSIELAEQIYNSLKIKYSPKEIEEQLWFTNYDTVECMIPIPNSLIEDFNARIVRLNISRQYLNGRINANESLSQEDLDDNTIVYNQWYHRVRDGESAQCIKINLSENLMNGILDNKFEVSSYVFVFCILFYLLKIEKHGDLIRISDEDNTALMKQTAEILNAHKFFSISEKNLIVADKKNKEELYDTLSSFDTDNIEIINDILSGFRYASEHNIKLTNERLRNFNENMHWNLGFMLKVISLDFRVLEKTSLSDRKKVIEEIEEIIQRYTQAEGNKYNIEEY